MQSLQPQWKRYQELRPDELASCLQTAPVAFWPLGLIEHHGWHLPVGYDGLKAERICIRIAEETGGVILPTMWWGANGGHGDFLWTHYQSEEATTSILVNTTEQLIRFGFRVIVLLAGHYPWQGLLEKQLPTLQAKHPEVLLLWGTEMSICGEAVKLNGDHAAREETSYGLCLFPELIDMNALRPGRDASAWPQGDAPPTEKQHPGVCFDPNEPLFGQMGADSRTASAARGEEGITRLVNHLATTIHGYLERE
ncbi:MAG: creatininase family protein [Candidatus Poribacteria bacterium]|nr:creatininase family protein [Candidatus Poribacteria bacterium]